MPASERFMFSIAHHLCALTRRGQRFWRHQSPWLVAALLIALLVASPLFAIVYLALTPGENIWPHLLANVLPGAVTRTLILMLGVGVVTLLVGTATAWVMTMYHFPGRSLLSWALLLPLAVPTYLTAFCYVELLDYSGTLQTAFRSLFGFTSARQYWFPDVRSMSGAIFVMGFVLYPYVYLTARASFAQQSANVLEAARLLGRTPWGAFREVALPLARPALVAGVALALMECLNDIGATEYLGVETLTVSVYATWLERSNLAGAAQIACVMLVFVLVLFALERLGRRGKGYAGSAKTVSVPAATPLRGMAGWGVALACTLPILFGFVLPMSVLVKSAWVFWEEALSWDYLLAVYHSLVLSVLAAGLAVTLAVILAFARRTSPPGAHNVINLPIRLASIGYAVPGTVLAVGILIPLAGFDNALDHFTREMFGFSTGLLLSGSLFAIVIAYTVRFMAVALGSIEAGLGKISGNLDGAARTLGLSHFGVLRQILLPILRPALAVAALMVFVDSMKELPATLLLRPFNFETLATHVYKLADNDMFEEAAFSALSIVAIGLVPVLILHHTMTQRLTRGKPS